MAVAELTQLSGQNTDSRTRMLSGLRPAWQPGRSGNPGGRPKSAILRKAAMKHLRASVAEGVDQLDCVVDSTIQTAIAGGAAGVAAFTAIRDTVDGKPGPAENDNSFAGIQIQINCIGVGDK